MTLCCSSSSSSSYRRAGAVALGWSLFAFNLGVEIGQACIVGAVAPLLAMVRERAPRLGRQIVTGRLGGGRPGRRLLVLRARARATG